MNVWELTQIPLAPVIPRRRVDEDLARSIPTGKLEFPCYKQLTGCRSGDRGAEADAYNIETVRAV